MVKSKKSKTNNIITVLAILGFLISVFLTYNFYSSLDSGSHDFCNTTGIGSCSKVTQSVFSTLFGIPVAFLGALWFFILFVLNSFTSINKSRKSSLYSFVWSVVGLIFVLYLIYAEIVLNTICLWCTVVHIIVVINFFLVFRMYKKR
jgi:uncharacterized membrane protein